MLKYLLNLDFNQTLAFDLLKNYEYPWEVLKFLTDFIKGFGKKLPKSIFEEIDNEVWVAYNCKIEKNVSIIGPTIIDEYSQIRNGAYIRGSVISGKKSVIGNSTEVKNSILFNEVQLPHFNYVGDSIVGHRSHLGAGAIISNMRSDKQNIKIKFEKEIIETGLKKLGGIIGDFVEIGCNAVINPGSIIGKNSIIYPLSMVRGVVKENSIHKNNNEIISKVLKY